MDAPDNDALISSDIAIGIPTTARTRQRCPMNHHNSQMLLAHPIRIFWNEVESYSHLANEHSISNSHTCTSPVAVQASKVIGRQKSGCHFAVFAMRLYPYINRLFNVLVVCMLSTSRFYAQLLKVQASETCLGPARAINNLRDGDGFLMNSTSRLCHWSMVVQIESTGDC